MKKDRECAKELAKRIVGDVEIRRAMEPYLSRTGYKTSRVTELPSIFFGLNQRLGPASDLIESKYGSDPCYGANVMAEVIEYLSTERRSERRGKSVSPKRPNI